MFQMKDQGEKNPRRTNWIGDKQLPNKAFLAIILKMLKELRTKKQLDTEQ